ncbi:MFS transporter, partial [Bifidobacterium bifidum]
MPTTPVQPSETQLPAAQHETEQPNTSPEPQPQPQPKAAHPLRSRNFILLVAGQGISLFGNMMLRFAMSMWVLDETGSATAFASILAISFVPMILGAPFGGVLADRMNRRTLMVILDAASAVTVALALVWFSAAGFSIIAVGVMQVALSLLGIFETPTVESALPQMLRQYGDATLNTSAAIVSQVQQVSALIPSFLGGAVYSFFGIRPMMAVSVAAFAGAAAIECFIRLGMPERDEEMPTPLDDLKAALRFLTREKPNLLKMVLLASAL